jgi:hypothetical protein
MTRVVISVFLLAFVGAAFVQETEARDRSAAEGKVSVVNFHPVPETCFVFCYRYYFTVCITATHAFRFDLFLSNTFRSGVSSPHPRKTSTCNVAKFVNFSSIREAMTLSRREIIRLMERGLRTPITVPIITVLITKSGPRIPTVTVVIGDEERGGQCTIEDIVLLNIKMLCERKMLSRQLGERYLAITIIAINVFDFRFSLFNTPWVLGIAQAVSQCMSLLVVEIPTYPEHCLSCGTSMG